MQPSRHIASLSRVVALRRHLAPLRNNVAHHPLYLRLSTSTLEDVQIFMESHVFASWAMMTLLKALQCDLTCVTFPWIPSQNRQSRRFINMIVLGQESDLQDGRPISHFEMYLEAMESAGADTGSILRIVREAAKGFDGLQFDGVPQAAKKYIESTFRVVREGSVAAKAGALAFGREDPIPAMFSLLLGKLNQGSGKELNVFFKYLEHHIKVDCNDHGPLSLKIVLDVCRNDEWSWQEATWGAEAALHAQIKLWDGVLDSITSYAGDE